MTEYPEDDNPLSWYKNIAQIISLHTQLEEGRSDLLIHSRSERVKAYRGFEVHPHHDTVTFFQITRPLHDQFDPTLPDGGYGIHILHKDSHDYVTDLCIEPTIAAIGPESVVINGCSGTMKTVSLHDDERMGQQIQVAMRRITKTPNETDAHIQQLLTNANLTWTQFLMKVGRIETDSKRGRVIHFTENGGSPVIEGLVDGEDVFTIPHLLRITESHLKNIINSPFN